MNIKEKLIELKEKLSQLNLPISRDFEFDAELEDHPIGNQNIYRLHYVGYHRIGEGYGCRKNNIGVINWQFKPFMLPKGMTREEGFKVLSYLAYFIKKNEYIVRASFKSVELLDSILDLGKLGFPRIDETIELLDNVLNLERLGFTRVDEKDENKILDLFAVYGRPLLFKNSNLYPKYFEWYTENITKEEVESIYAKYNMEFRDIIWLDNQNNKNENNPKTLKLQNNFQNAPHINLH